MCGIFGFIVIQPSKQDSKQYLSLLEKLFLLSETRGKDASGLLVAGREKIEILKQPFRARTLIKSQDYKKIRNYFLECTQSDAAVLAMGHARMVTNGKASSHYNNQPVIRGEFACIHNGIVVNDESLWEQYPDLQRRYEVDTEVILALLENFQSKGQPMPQALCNVYRHIKGANSIALISNTQHALSLATTNGSLFIALSEDRRFAIFASEKYILDQALQCSEFPTEHLCTAPSQIMPGKAIILDYGATCIEPYPMGISEFTFETFGLNTLQQSKLMIDIRSASEPVTPQALQYDFATLERLCKIDQNRIKSLRRCTRCILPETFPFITFDADGVCSYCHNYKPWSGPGPMGLEQLVQPFRTGNGRPDCLVPFSGGRDSSYALHYICKELHLNPVAYTYDWGMITDLARRNISRMCGALGIEHILISADIAQKRANIRMNVSAWLKKPHLGTVTLFMAGDKHFFYYARMLQKQMKLSATLFGMNPFERTDFKVAFCGINENYPKDIHYNLKIVNKLKMMAFFGTRFLENPSYLNRTILDSFIGFFSYYFIPKDYYSIYDYIYWDEQMINDTLLSEYDWETSPDTKSTWRIGDGTAPFYNYIYYKVAGFSENDTLRSNQIREGKLKRNAALQLVHEDNLPRVESIRWYCETIGIDPGEAIKRINTIPVLY